jgi:hypothetical protein
MQKEASDRIGVGKAAVQNIFFASSCHLHTRKLFLSFFLSFFLLSLSLSFYGYIRLRKEAFGKHQVSNYGAVSEHEKGWTTRLPLEGGKATNSFESPL